MARETSSYSVADSLGGRGGRERRQKIDDIVDGGGGRQSQSVASASAEGGRVKPSYTPSADERRTRSYGTPMAEPLVGKPKHERRER